MLIEYPEAPHVSLGLYLDTLTEDRALAALCEALLAQGGIPAGQVVLAPSDQSFETVTDLAPSLLQLVLRGADAVHRLREELGRTSGVRVVAAGIRIPGLGDGVVTYEPADHGEAHPVAALFAADELGIPQVNLSSAEVAKARRRAGALVRLLRAACEALDPLYAGIGSELAFPSPARLRPDIGRLGTEVFASRRLLAAHDRLEAKLRQCFTAGTVEVWSNGIFCSGWEPFNEQRRSLPAPLDTSRHLLGVFGEAVRRAVHA